MVHLLLLLALHILLTALPGVAAALFASRKGITEVPVLLAIALAAAGVAAILAFWAYFATPLIGKIFSYAVLLGADVVTVWVIAGGTVDRQLLRQLAIPLGLWVLGSTFLVFLGFLHGGIGSPLSTGATRFTNTSLPTDNDIPRYFTDWFYAHGHRGTPPIYPPNFLFSDRPPLQVGYMLLQRPVIWDKVDLNYQIIGVLLQQLWIVALWALLLAARVGRVTRALAVLAVLISNVALVNGFFVWPKMLPAAMLIAAAALVVTPLWTDLRRKRSAAVLVASLFAVAMLGHGSSIFGIVPLALIAAVRGIPNWRWLAVGLAVGFALLYPWSAYQKYVDPPGNRLTKEALAGVANPDHNSLSKDIIDAYRRAGVGGTLHNKAENLVTIVGARATVNGVDSAADSLESGHAKAALGTIRTILFFYFLPSMGLLAFAPLLMAAGRRRRASGSPEWTLAVGAYAVAFVGCVIWGLVLFGNWTSMAVLHEGSYALPVLALCAAVAGTRAVFPHFASWLVGVNVLLVLVVDVPSVDPPPGTSYSVTAAVIAIACLAGFLALALRHDPLRVEAADRSAAPRDCDGLVGPSAAR